MYLTIYLAHFALSICFSSLCSRVHKILGWGLYVFISSLWYQGLTPGSFPPSILFGWDEEGGSEKGKTCELRKNNLIIGVKSNNDDNNNDDDERGY